MAISRRGFFRFLLQGAGVLAASWAATKAVAYQFFREVLPARSPPPTKNG